MLALLGASSGAAQAAPVSPWDNPDAVASPPAAVPAPSRPPAATPRRKKPPSHPRMVPPSERAPAPDPDRTPPPSRPAATPRPRPERGTSTTQLPVSEREATSEDEEQERPAQRPVPPAPHRRKLGAGDDPGGRAEPQAEAEDEETPRSRRIVARRKHVAAEDEESGDKPDEDEDADDRETTDGDTAPVLAPRLVSLALEATALGRSFRFDTPLQSENSFPRVGATLQLEAYPLLSLTRDFYRLFGLGIMYGREMGQAAVPQINGSTISFPVVQSRWQLDVRYPLAVTPSFVIMPALGYGVSAFNLQRGTPVNPSACPVGTAEACLPNISLASFALDLTLRYALTSSAAISLLGGYLLGSSVGRAPGNIASEAAATASGYHLALGATYALTDWLAIVAEGELIHHGYAFSSPAVTYRSATETYYGAGLGLRIFTK